MEIQRRGVENASQVAGIMDGSDWLQGFLDYHRPDAERILDFPHAGEHLSVVGESLYGEGTPRTQEWLQKRLHQLKHEGPRRLFTELRRLKTCHPEIKEIPANLNYLQKREPQLQYPHFQADGWPIGNGIVESGNKLVVEVRLIGSGMHWAEQNVNPMLALRNIICSRRWKEEWPKVAAQLRRQTARKRQAIHQARVDAKTTLPQKVLPQPLPIPNFHLDPLPTTQLLQTKLKPNPWKKFKFGRNLYRRSDPPKN